MSKKGGHHGGTWKVAYADFVTAMMALFLCLWLTAQDAKIKEAVERAFRNPFSAVNKESTGIIPMKDTVASMMNSQGGQFSSATVFEMEMIRHITEDIAKMLEQSQEMEQTVNMELTPEGLRINVFDRSQKPIFEVDQARFTDYGNWVFSTLAWEIARYTTFHIELEGHTDSQLKAGREGTEKWELSTERANSARRKLVSSGVSPDQIFKVSGFADTQPLIGRPATAQANRRVTVMLKLPSGDHLNETASITPPTTPSTQ